MLLLGGLELCPQLFHLLQNVLRIGWNGLSLLFRDRRQLFQLNLQPLLLLLEKLERLIMLSREKRTQECGRVRAGDYKEQSKEGLLMQGVLGSYLFLQS